jgi:hypothetical protein
MTFKEQATADLSTFLNVDEFADRVDIDGDLVVCSIEGNGDTVGDGDGITNVDTVLYVKTADFYKRLVVGQRINVDSRPANVIGVVEDQGILTIRLQWMDS